MHKKSFQDSISNVFSKRSIHEIKQSKGVEKSPTLKCHILIHYNKFHQISVPFFANKLEKEI